MRISHQSELVKVYTDINYTNLKIDEFIRIIEDSYEQYDYIYLCEKAYYVWRLYVYRFMPELIYQPKQNYKGKPLYWLNDSGMNPEVAGKDVVMFSNLQFTQVDKRKYY